MAFSLKVPTLEEVNKTHVAISLWKNFFPKYNITEWPNEQSAEVKDELNFDTPTTDMQRQFTEIYSRICLSADELYPSIPKFLTREIKTTPVRSIGMELYSWLRSINYNITRLDRHTSELCTKLTKWTVHGKIDVRESAEKLCKCEELPLITKFEIACGFFIMDAVKEFWLQLPEGIKGNFEEIPGTWRNIAFSYWKLIMDFNANADTSELAHEVTFDNKIEFLASAVKFKIFTAVRHFVGLFSTEERGKAILYAVQKLPSYKFGTGEREILHFLLTQLDERNLKLIFESNDTRLTVVNCLVGDPVYASFVPSILNRVRNCLEGVEFFCVISTICDQAMALRSHSLRMSFDYVWNNAEFEWMDFILNN